MKILSISPREIDFINYRRDVALILKKDFEIVVACEPIFPDREIAEQFDTRDIAFNRGSLNPLVVFSEIKKLRSFFVAEKIDLYIAYTYKLSLLSSFASIFLNIRKIHVLTGMGYSFTSYKLKAKLIKLVAIVLAKIFFRKHDLVVLNEADYQLVRKLKFSKRIHLIAGEGIDPLRFHPENEPQSGFHVTYVGRFLRDKGVLKFLPLAERLHKLGVPIQFHLYGSPDEQNPESITPIEFSALEASPFIKVHGFTRDINRVWAKSNVCILLSKREGLPQSLLEAMACKRCILASNIDACRAIIKDGMNGYLVDEGNEDEIVAKLYDLYQNPSRRSSFAENAYQKLVLEFSAQSIAEKYRKVIKGERFF